MKLNKYIDHTLLKTDKFQKSYTNLDMYEEYHGMMRNFTSFIPNSPKKPMAACTATTLHGKNTGAGMRTTLWLLYIIQGMVFLMDIWCI